MRTVRDLFGLYRGLLPVYWREAVARRARVWLNVLSLSFPFLMMWVWLQVARQQGGSVAGLDTGYFVTYYTAAAVVSQVTTVSAAGNWDKSIRLGTLSARLLRPCDPGHHVFCSELCRRMLAGLFGLPFVIVVLLLPATGDHDPIMVLMSLVAMVVGFTLNFLMASAIGMLAFWLTQVQRIHQLWAGVGSMLAGAVAPLETMPTWIRMVAEALPFKATYGTPVEMLAGQTTVAAGLQALAFGLAWTVVAYVVYRLLWARGLRRYSSVGA